MLFGMIGLLFAPPHLKLSNKEGNRIKQILFKTEMDLIGMQNILKGIQWQIIGQM
jgi:hypothetical protein